MIYRILFITWLSLLASGCQTLDYQASEGSLIMRNLITSEAFDAYQQTHKVLVSFDYEFTRNFVQPSMYFCSVQFLGKHAGRSYSGVGNGPVPCQFKEARGSVMFRVSTPFDGKHIDQHIIENLRLPVQYFVAIHQKTANNTSSIIAYSETFQSTK